MIAPPDYAFAEKQARLENAELLRARLTAPDVVLKIQNWAERYGFEPEFIRFKVLTDDTFALQFIKDPAKQSIHQRVAAEHIRTKIPLVEEFKTPPSGGSKALYVVRGMYVEGSTLHAATNNHGKSIDFMWSYTKAGKTLRVFATHKHTKEEGGSQDNQFADIKRFLSEAQSCKNVDVLFLAICDGAYYQNPYNKRATRLQALAEDNPGPRTRACTIGDLPCVWGNELAVWMETQKLTPTPEESAAIQFMTT